MRNRAQVLEEYAVIQARAGEQRGISVLVEIRGPKLLAHATRLLGHHEDALDIVQDAWVEILRGLKNLREPSAFPSWSTRIVSRCCARFISKQIKRRKLATEFANEVQFVPEAITQEVDEIQLIHAAIQSLPAAQSATIALFYLEEMSVTEVAIALDVPPGTVKSRLVHAREELKQTLKGKIDE